MSTFAADYTDDVRGEVIGLYLLQWALFYDGRQQGQTAYSESEEEALQEAARRRCALVKEFGGHPCMLYPDPRKWEVRFWS